MNPIEFYRLFRKRDLTKYELQKEIFAIQADASDTLIHTFMAELEEERQRDFFEREFEGGFEGDKKGKGYKYWQILEEYGINIHSQECKYKKPTIEDYTPHCFYDWAINELKKDLNEVNDLKTPTENELKLPDELNTERARIYFAKALDAGMMVRTQSGYKWEFGESRGKARLAYFIERVYCPAPTDTIPIEKRKSIESLFNICRLDRALQQNADSGKSRSVKQWRAEIDNKVFHE